MSSKRLHWLAPSTVLLAFLAAILFALGHHLFYWSLQGNAVPNNNYKLLGTDVPRQQINIAAGTAFAFLVNFALAAALAAAYAQVFWRQMRHRETTLDALDTTYSAISDLSQLFKVWIWWKYPLLACLAVIAWLLPIASIVTPGTLSIGNAPVSPPQTVQQQVPNVDFTSLNYVNSMPRAGQDGSSENNSKFLYDGPSKTVQQIANQAAAAGSILPINGPFPNATWQLDFPGPGLQCVEVPQSIRTTAQNRLLSSIWPSGENCVAHGYFAWVGNSVDVVQNISLSFGNFTGAPLAINFAIMPNMMDVDPAINDEIPYLYACQNQDARQRLFEDSTMMQCQLRNYTYYTNFDYTNGQQNITTTADPIDNSSVQPLDFVRGWAYAYDQYTQGGIDCTVLGGGVNHEDPCSVDETVLRTLSYQAIFDAFQSLVVGTVSRENAADSVNVDTAVNNTILINTPDLQYLRSSTSSSTLSLQPLQQYIMASNRTIFNGLVNTESLPTFGSIGPTIEELFRNVTISMMTYRSLQPNLTSAFAPQPVNITLRNFHNVYVYSATKLWLAYGLSILFTLVATAIGFWALVTEGASYRDNFSTVFRIARGADVSVAMNEEDLDGNDPIPAHVKNASIRLRPAGVIKEDAEKMTRDLDHNDPIK